MVLTSDGSADLFAHFHHTDVSFCEVLGFQEKFDQDGGPGLIEFFEKIGQFALKVGVAKGGGPEIVKSSGGWFGCMRSLTKTKPTTVDYQKREEAFLQGGEKEASALFNELLRVTIRKGLLGVMPQEMESLGGPRHHPDLESSCHRAGSEKGTA
ncbi:MAG: hypothetical protein ACI9NQ_000277 [Paracoccaceae bacterium]